MSITQCTEFLSKWKLVHFLSIRSLWSWKLCFDSLVWWRASKTLVLWYVDKARECIIVMPRSYIPTSLACGLSCFLFFTRIVMLNRVSIHGWRDRRAPHDVCFKNGFAKLQPRYWFWKCPCLWQTISSEYKNIWSRLAAYKFVEGAKKCEPNSDIERNKTRWEDKYETGSGIEDVCHLK